ncbi:MAG TPA: PHP domain-containing protein [Microbacteriaceae bacterium]|nr:PHP domain-containing protein [Microbacteriaceae bacterium]HQX35324.1 PHP domain-containing protein [Microbacteriaceae bacterium]
MHSSQSDGTEPPAEVVAAAHRFGMRTMALTDHDTTSGWAEAGDAARALGVTFIPGMELSAAHEGRSVHILAYLIDPEHAGLRRATDRIRDSRIGRAEAMVKNIGRDYDFTWDDVLAQTTDGATVGRPHIADALVARGYAHDRSAAFNEILHPARGYFVSHYAPDPATAVSLINEAGGVAVIAHPVPAGRGRMLPMGVLRELIGLGLGGFEIGHRENTDEGKRTLRQLAREHDLIVTGSSDYHGTGKPNQPGEFTTTDEMVERIIAQATGSAPVFA